MSNNAAAMRAALERCNELFRCDDDNKSRRCHLARKADEATQSALSKPARNCDVGTATEQEKRFRAFCDSNWDLNNTDDNCARCPLNKIMVGGECEFAWMQMPYEGKGESNE